jgi:hypothetical protein
VLLFLFFLLPHFALLSKLQMDIITNPSQKFHVVVVVVQDFMVASARCKPYDSSKAMEQPEPSVQEISKLIKLLQDRVMEDIEHQGKREGLPSTLYQATSARLEPSVSITKCYAKTRRRYYKVLQSDKRIL